MVLEVKADDGINYSRKNDLYLNSDTGNIYKRTDTGNVNNFWTKIGCLKGPTGNGAYQEAVEEGFTGTRAEWLLTLVGQSNLTEKRWDKPLIADEGTDMQVWYYYQIDGNDPNTAWKYIITPPDGTYPAGDYAFNLNTKYYTFTSTQEMVIGDAGIYNIKYIADERNGKLTAYLTNKETSEETEYTLDITIQSSVPEGFTEVKVDVTPLGKWVQTMYLGTSKTNCEEITITTGMSLDGIITSDIFYGVIGESSLKIGVNIKDAINKIFDMLKENESTVLNTKKKTVFEAINELFNKKYMDCYELIDSDLLTHCLSSEYKTLTSNFIYCENCTNTPSGNNGYGYVMMIISQDPYYRQLIFFDPANGKISTNNIGANETIDGFGEWSGWIYGLTSNDITTTIDSSSTDKQIVSAKAVYEKTKNMCTTNVADAGTNKIKFSYNTNYEVVNDNCKYIIKNGICTMFLYVKCKTPANTWKTVSKAPKTSFLNMCSTISSLNGDGFLRCSVNSTGDLSFANGIAGTSYLGTIMYQVSES